MLRGISLFTAWFSPTPTRRWRRISCCCSHANGTCIRTGQLPAYEWNFSDVNPPVQAWAALAVFRIDGATDFDFLARVFNKLLINFTWWVNREDARGDNIFEGGFLGLDNIGPFDRSKMLQGEVLEQSDGTAWMAKYCLNMLEIALLLANRNPVYEDVAIKFFEHFALIAAAMENLWDEQDGFFYDRLRTQDGSAITVRARSMVGLLPVFAAVELDPSLWQRLPMFRERARWYLEHRLRTKNHLYYLPSERPARSDLARREVALPAHPGPYARRERISVALRIEIALALPPGTPSGSRFRRSDLPARLRAWGVAHRPLWRQLQLAGAGLVSAELPRHRVAAAPSQFLRRRVDGRAADRIGPQGEFEPGRRDELRRRLAQSVSCSTRTAGARPMALTPVSRKTPSGGIRSFFMNTSTARPARVLAPRIRPDGRRLPRRSLRTGALAPPPSRQAELPREARRLRSQARLISRIPILSRCRSSVRSVAPST